MNYINILPIIATVSSFVIGYWLGIRDSIRTVEKVENQSNSELFNKNHNGITRIFKTK